MLLSFYSHKFILITEDEFSQAKILIQYVQNVSKYSWQCLH